MKIPRAGLICVRCKVRPADPQSTPKFPGAGKIALCEPCGLSLKSVVAMWLFNPGAPPTTAQEQTRIPRSINVPAQARVPHPGRLVRLGLVCPNPKCGRENFFEKIINEPGVIPFICPHCETQFRVPVTAEVLTMLDKQESQ